MQPLCVVSRAPTKVTVSKNQAAEVIIDTELLMFAVSIRDYFANIISSSHIILPDNLTNHYCLLNDQNHRHHNRLNYSMNYEKYPNYASKRKYIGISKFSLVS